MIGDLPAKKYWITECCPGNKQVCKDYMIHTYFIERMKNGKSEWKDKWVFTDLSFKTARAITFLLNQIHDDSHKKPKDGKDCCDLRIIPQLRLISAIANASWQEIGCCEDK